MSKGKSGSWDVPTRSRTGVIGFENPLAKAYWQQGKGQSGYYGWEFLPKGQSYYDQLTAMRDAILSELGYTSPARESSLNRWEKAFTREALRTSMPKLEQTLFSRGLGGSRFYKDAVTDLLSKVATQSVLNRENLALQDELLKLKQLATLNPEMWKLIQMGEGLSRDTANVTEKQYQQMLPYMAKYESEPGMFNVLGQGVGGLATLALAPFTGGASLAYLPMAMEAGNIIGGTFNKGPSSNLDLSSLLPQALKVAHYGEKKYGKWWENQ